MQEAGARRPLLGAQAAAGYRVPLQADHVQAGAAEMGLQDQAVVAGPEDDAVAGGVRHGRRRYPESWRAAAISRRPIASTSSDSG